MTGYGSDVVVRWLEQAGVDHVALNPGATFRGLHDSVVRSGTIRPVTVLHEEIAIGIAHGYAKATGRPMAAMVHNLVGLQHASMAVFNAYIDNAPMIVLGGSGPRDSARRRPWIDWIHTGNSQSDIVRDIVKWHAEPASVQSLAPTLARAYRIATTVPMGPVYLSIDADLQEAALARPPDVTSWPAVAGPRLVAAPDEVARLARMLAAAHRPVFVVDRPAPGASAPLVELAERTGAAVIDFGARCTFPSEHWADQTFDRGAALAEADLVVALEARDLAWAVTEVDLGDRSTRLLVSPDATVVSVGMTETQHRGFVDREAMMPGVDQILSDVGEMLRALLAEVPGRRDERRVDELRGRHTARRAASRDAALASAGAGRIEVPWLVHCLGEAIAGRPWQLANGVAKDWPRRLWDLRDEGAYLGRSGGEGLGYGLPASIGASLAAADDLLVVDIQSDGDLMYTASGLWTLAHHRLPLLVVVYNNRTYGKDLLHQTQVAEHRSRSRDTLPIGIALTPPDIDYVKLAESQGVEGRGPVVEPGDLPGVLADAARIVRTERRSVLVDVVTHG